MIATTPSYLKVGAILTLSLQELNHVGMIMPAETPNPNRLIISLLFTPVFV